MENDLNDDPLFDEEKKIGISALCYCKSNISGVYSLSVKQRFG